MCVVLVADDEPMIRDFVCAILRSAGHQCFSAANGLEAVAVFRSNPGTIDLVVTDVTMPVMNGAQAAARIRETKPGVPVVFMSGYIDVELPPGAHILHKPFTTQELVDTVRQLAPGRSS